MGEPQVKKQLMEDLYVMRSLSNEESKFVYSDPAAQTSEEAPGIGYRRDAVSTKVRAAHHYAKSVADSIASGTPRGGSTLPGTPLPTVRVDLTPDPRPASPRTPTTAQAGPAERPWKSCV